MSYDNLMRVQFGGEVVLAACLLTGAVILIAGLISPRLIGLSGRGWVILTSLALWLVGIGAWVGSVAYTHSQPNGPHSMESYLDGETAIGCVSGDRSAERCVALKQKCAERDPTHPACRILAGEDAGKFYSTTVRE
jgi:hypothetical protein